MMPTTSLLALGGIALVDIESLPNIDNDPALEHATLCAIELEKNGFDLQLDSNKSMTGKYIISFRRCGNTEDDLLTEIYQRAEGGEFIPVDEVLRMAAARKGGDRK